MLHLNKLMLNSSNIEDVVEVGIELGKKFVREKFVFHGDFFFCSTIEVDGLVSKNDNSVST